MVVKLGKGEKAPLKQGLDKIKVVLGWREPQNVSRKFDLDASCFLLNANNKVNSSRDFIYYNQQKTWCGVVKYGGDVQKGGDDCETFEIDLSKIPANIEKLVFTVTIHRGRERGQRFGALESAYITLLDLSVNDAIAQFYLKADAADEIAVIFGELYRANGDWSFCALGEGFNSGDPNCRHELAALARHFGAR